MITSDVVSTSQYPHNATTDPLAETGRQPTFIVLVTFQSLLEFLALFGRQRTPLQETVDLLTRVSNQVKRSGRLKGLDAIFLCHCQVTTCSLSKHIHFMYVCMLLGQTYHPIASHVHLLTY